MRRTIYINIIRRTLLTLCLMATATMVWAVDVSTEAELIVALANESEPTITLMDNIALTNTLTITRNLTLDLNGHSITSDGKRAIHITSGENVLITSATPALISTSGSIADNSSVIRVGGDSGDQRNVGLTIDQNVTVSTDKCYGITVFGTNTKETLVVNGTVATTTVAASAISGNGDGKYRTNETSITIGTTAHISAANDVAIYHPQLGTLEVNGTVTGAGGIEIKAGKLIVGDEAKITAEGTISHTVNTDGTSTRGYAIAIVENALYAGVSTIKISDEAKITGPIAEIQDSPNANHHPDFSESKVKMAVEVVGGKQFTTLADAMNDVAADGTLRILEPIALKNTIEIDKNLTINLNGKNITATNAGAFWVKKGTVNFTGTGTIAVENITDNDNAVIRVGDEVAGPVSLTIGSDVVVNAAECYGIKLTGTNTTESLTVEGKVSTQNRPAICGDHNGQTITVANGAVITTTDEVAIYQPLPGALTINGTVNGASAVELKAGTLAVGATANLDATAPVAHTPNDNGTSSRGYAIAAVENKNNAGNINVTVADGATLDANDPIASLWDSEYTNSATKPTFSENVKMVAAIDKDLYHKLPHAIAFVPSDGTVRLLDDMTLSETLVMSREVTSSLDLDGHTLTGNGCTAVTVKGGHVTITSSAETPRASITSNASTTIIQLGDNTGDKRATSLTIRDKVDITTTTANGINVAGSKTRESLTVYGNVNTSGKPAIIGSGDAEKGGTTITIAPSSTITTSNNVAIYHPQSGELVIDGKVIGTGTTAGAIEMKGGDLTVAAGATVTATGSTVHSARNDAPSTNGYAIAIVENENFSGVGKVFIDKTAAVTGVIATLIDSENDNVAEPEFNGDIYMLAEVMKTETRGEKYSTLKDAVAAATESKTVRLLDYITLTETLDVDKSITLNLDVYDITGNQASGAVIAVSDGATLKNGGIITAQQGIEITGGTVNLQQLDIKADAGSLVISGGTVTADKASTFTSSNANTMAISNGAVVTINGKVENTGANAAISATGSETTTALTVNNGATVTSTGKGIDWENAGALTINGGKVSGSNAVYANAGSVTINGGTFTGTAEAVKIENNEAVVCTPSIKHGTFYTSAANAIVSTASGTGTKAAAFVEGDYFQATIDQDICAIGYMISESKNNNGMFYLISELVITDATIWAPTATYTIKNAKYIRNSGMGTTKFGTLCLPFAFSATQTGMKFYSVNRIADNTLYLDETTGTDGMIAAGTPVIFQRTGTPLATSFTIEETDAFINKDVVAETANGLVGTFATNTTVTGGALETAYYLNGDHFHQADTQISVPPFRAYIVYPSQSPAKQLNICINDEVDAIENVLLQHEIEAIYDLQGRMQNDLQPGMNIIKMANGKTIKVMVK